MTIHEILTGIPYEEDARTLRLFDFLATIKETGYLTREQLLSVLKWKSPRPDRFYQLNKEDNIKNLSQAAFSLENDSYKLHLLTALDGVNYPAASAVLMFYDHTIFPVLDIRVWKQLYRLQLVSDNSRGQNFTFNQCGKYLHVIRQLSEEYKCTAREVEKRLFDYDRITQVGNLYQ